MNYSESHPMIEALEGREFFSVTVHAAVAAPKAAPTHAVVMSATPAVTAASKAAAKAAAKAANASKVAAKSANKVGAATTVTPVAGDFPTYIPAKNTFAAPNITGEWTGTLLIDGEKQGNDFSVNLAFQHGVAASGTFNLGATVGNQSVVSTVVFGTNRAVRVLILSGNLWMGFTGALAANGNVMIGRFSVNTANGWQTGTFTLNRK